MLQAFTEQLCADSVGPFQNFREVAAGGRYYVVVKKDATVPARTGLPITFEIAEGKPGSPPVMGASDLAAGAGLTAANPDVSVRAGDILLGHGKLQILFPSILLVSSTGLGFVNIGVVPHGLENTALCDAVVIVSQDGHVRVRKTLTDLFNPNEISDFGSSGIGLRWCARAWIDEEQVADRCWVSFSGRLRPHAHAIPGD